MRRIECDGVEWKEENRRGEWSRRRRVERSEVKWSAVGWS